jgi:uncharacterized cupin superfamily protein
VLAGEVVLVTDDGEEILHTEDAAGFKADDPDGHSFQNRSSEDVLLLEIGTPAIYTHKDGTPYEDIKCRGPSEA